MSNLKTYLHAIYETEDGFDKVIKVPKFSSREIADEFIKKMKVNHIVDDDIIDPHTGEILLAKNESKDDYNRAKKELEKKTLSDYLNQQKGNNEQTKPVS